MVPNNNGEKLTFFKRKLQRTITLCLHKSNQKTFLAPQNPKKPTASKPNEQVQKSKNTSGSEYTSLKGTLLAPKDSVFALIHILVS
jgi:hypothetical protein